MPPLETAREAARALERPAVPTPRRFTVDEYHRMAEAGVFHPDERVELLDGVVITVASMGSPHAMCIVRLTDRLVPALGQRALVRVQLPLRLDDRSEPEPDLALVRRHGPRAYLTRHPAPADTLLVIEAGDSSAERDREEKAPCYARAGVPELWLIDLGADLVRVLRRPVAGEWSEARVLRRGDSVAPEAFPELELPVDELLGPR